MDSRRVTLAVTGASGSQYALRLLDCLVKADVDVYFLISQAAQCRTTGPVTITIFHMRELVFELVPMP